MVVQTCLKIKLKITTLPLNPSPRAHLPRCGGHDPADGGQPVGALLQAQLVECDRPRAAAPLLVRRRLTRRGLTGSQVVLVQIRSRMLATVAATLSPFSIFQFEFDTRKFVFRLVLLDPEAARDRALGTLGAGFGVVDAEGEELPADGAFWR